MGLLDIALGALAHVVDFRGGAQIELPLRADVLLGQRQLAPKRFELPGIGLLPASASLRRIRVIGRRQPCAGSIAQAQARPTYRRVSGLWIHEIPR
jgi:hypothetical protein